MAEALIALAPQPDGFTAHDLADKVRHCHEFREYTARQAAYDLRKFGGKCLLHKQPRSRYYSTEVANVRLLAGLIILREKVIKPVLAGIGRPHSGRPRNNVMPIDTHYRKLQGELWETFKTLKLAA